MSLAAELVEAAQGLQQGISAVEGNLLFATNEGNVHDVDLNNYTENGIYFYTYSSAPTIQNSPFSNTGTTFLVLNFPSNGTYQIATDRTASELDKIAIRHYLDTGWSDWVYLVTNDNLKPTQVISITSIADPTNVTFNALKYTRIGNLVVGWIGGLRVLNKGVFVINNGDLPEPLTQVHVPVITSTTDVLIGNMYLDVNTKKLSIRGINPNPTGDKGYASFSYVAKQ